MSFPPPTAVLLAELVELLAGVGIESGGVVDVAEALETAEDQGADGVAWAGGR